MTWPNVARCQGIRCDRIRVIRIQLMIHSRKAEHNRITKGSFHFDTIHECEIMDELSSSLSREIFLLKEELKEQEERIEGIWENEVMEQMYEL